jgi:hypothetical protein
MRLVPVIVRLYLNLIYITSTLSFPLAYQRFRSRLQHLAHSHISIILLSLSQHHHFSLNHFRIYFMDNEFEKTY